MKVYIAGGIAGRSVQDYSTHFRRAETRLRNLGFDPVVPLDIPPHQHDGACPEGPAGGENPEHTAPCYMRTDLKALLDCDAIFMLLGWERSSGARAELDAARAAGLGVMFERPYAINDLAKDVHRMAVDHGFWEHDRNMGEMLMLATSELAEALEEHRDGKPPEYVGEDGKPEGVAVELADCIIRCLDTMGSLGVDIEAVIQRKIAYNRSRPFMHGKAY